MNKTNFYLKSFVFALVIILGFYSFFKRNHVSKVRCDIISRAISATIEDVQYFRDDYGGGIATYIKGDSIPFCFNGFTMEINDAYYGIARAGDSLIKFSNTDSFILKQHDTVYHFKIIGCGSRCK
ncbi:MAG TPA: hypothetical protein VKC90_03130 [Chitinophagaceae bacterium]|nr:hypothetical protein [Chitinophagaceae bacterium]